MKTLYKILFSLCSTIVCCAHSVRSFAASCTIFSALPADTCGNPTVVYGGVKTCAEQSQQGFVRLYHNTNNDCYVYATVYDCTVCANPYPTRTNRTYHIDSAAAKCDISYYDCLGTTQPTQPTGNCTTDADCTTVLGSHSMTSYLPDYRTGQPDVGLIYYHAKCRDENCVWILSTTQDWINSTISGNAELRSTATCTNAHYGSAGLISEGGKYYVDYCHDCPDIDATFIGGNAAYLAGHGTLIDSCYIKQGAQFLDLGGIFETTGNCNY